MSGMLQSVIRFSSYFDVNKALNSFTILNRITYVYKVRTYLLYLRSRLQVLKESADLTTKQKAGHFFVLFVDFVTMFWKFPNLHGKAFRDKTTIFIHQAPDTPFLINCIRHFHRLKSDQDFDSADKIICF